MTATRPFGAALRSESTDLGTLGTDLTPDRPYRASPDRLLHPYIFFSVAIQPLWADIHDGGTTWESP
jgi:hypothetical protein